MATDVIEGHVVQVAGPTIEIQFPEGHVPKILNAIHVTSEGFDVPVKIFSLQLFGYALVLAAPHIFRIVTALAGGAVTV